MKHFLDNEWCRTGNDEDTFKEYLDQVDASTEQKKVSLKDYFVEHIFINEDGEDMAYIIDPENVLPDGAVEDAPIKLDLLDEALPKLKSQTEEDGMLLLSKKSGETLIVSPQAYGTLGQRIALPGTAMQYSSLARECLVAEHIGKHMESKNCTIIIKTNEGISKVFAVLGPGYKHIPLRAISVIADVLKKESGLGLSECLGWSIDHKYLQITYAFPEYGKELCDAYDVDPMTPCVKLMTSDTGESAVRAVGYWRTDCGDMIYADEYSRAHKGDFDIDEITLNVRENIFDKYKEFPKRLKDLSYIPITPKTLDLSKEEHQQANARLLTNVYSVIIKELGLGPIIGRDRMKELDGLLELLIEGEVRYSAYAVAKDILSIPGMLKSWISSSELKGSGEEKLLKAVAKAPYLDYDKIMEKAAKKGKAMYFTPAEA